MNTYKYIIELLYQLSIGIVYFILALITLYFATIEGNPSLLWPSSGFALAVLIRFGAKSSVGVFLGAFTTSLYVGEPYFNVGMITLGNTIEPLLALYILKFLPFSQPFHRLSDYLSLLLAGSIGAIASASIGVSSGVITGYISTSNLFHILMHWWMGDALGILLLAPLLLMISQHSIKKILENKLIECLILIALSVVIAISIFTNVNNESFITLGGGYLLIIPLAWSALRFCQLITSFIIFQYFVIAVWGIINNQGMFIDSSMTQNLILLWVNFVAISLVSHIVSYSVNERKVLTQVINSTKTEIYIFYQDDMHFQFVNQTVLDNLGVSMLEALKLTPWDIKPLYSSQQFKELLLPLVNNEIDSLNFETVHQRQDGSIYPVEITLQSVQHANRDCYLASAVDISERVKRDCQHTLGNLFSGVSPQALVITDKDNKITRINSTFSRVTGYSENEVIGLNPRILNSGKHDKNFFQQLWYALISQGQWEGEIYNKRKSGELYLQHATIKVLHDAKGNIQNYIAMFNDITKKHDESIQQQRLSEHDELTALPNKLKLQQEFNYAKTSAKRLRNKLAILFFDLNDFKSINDHFGRMYGDRVLQIIANRMKSNIRETDLVARISGDEFIVLMTNIDTDGAIQTLINKLKTVIAEPILLDGFTFQVFTSSGEAEFPDQGVSLDDLINTADAKMYLDKAKMKQSLT